MGLIPSEVLIFFMENLGNLGTCIQVRQIMPLMHVEYTLDSPICNTMGSEINAINPYTYSTIPRYTYMYLS